MKRMKAIFTPTLAALSLVLGLAAFSGTAQAQSYTGNCADVPASVDGDIDITDSDCTIAYDVTATGNIQINASGTVSTQALNGVNISITASGDTTTDDINASGSLIATVSGGSFTSSDLNATGSAGEVTITTTGGSSAIIDVDGDITANGYTVVLQADGTIQANNIDASSSNGSNDVRLFPEQAGGSSPFVIGTSGTNGVASINDSYSSGNFTNVGVQPGGSGGIQVDGSAIDVSSSGGQSGSIVLNAGDGPITVTGTLNTDGSSGNPAGYLVLVGSTLTTFGGATISSSDGGSGDNHYLTIAVGSINYSGGLTLSADGNSANSGLYLGPQGSQSVNIPTDPTSPMTVDAWNPPNSPLTINGSDSGALTLNARGPSNYLNLSGSTLTFNGGTVNMMASQ